MRCISIPRGILLLICLAVMPFSVFAEEVPYLCRDMVDGTRHYIFYEGIGRSWQRETNGKVSGICMQGRCASFEEWLHGLCPVAMAQTRDPVQVTFVCPRHVTSPAEKSDTAVNRKERLSTSQMIMGELQEFRTQFSLEDVLQKLQKISIPQEWLQKGVAAFLIVGIVVYTLLMMCELLDRMGNWLLDRTATGISSLLQRWRGLPQSESLNDDTGQLPTVASSISSSPVNFPKKCHKDISSGQI